MSTHILFKNEKLVFSPVCFLNLDGMLQWLHRVQIWVRWKLADGKKKRKLSWVDEMANTRLVSAYIDDIEIESQLDVRHKLRN